MRRSAAVGLIRSIGTADSYFVVPTVQQHVALLVNRNPPGGGKRRLLCGVKRGDTPVSFAAYGPLVVSPWKDVLIFTHSTSPKPEKRQLNYIDNLRLKKYDTFCRR